MRPRKYRNKFLTSLITEKENIEILHAIGETVPRAFELGLKILIETYLEDAQSQASSDALSRIAEYKERETVALEKLYTHVRTKETVIQELRSQSIKKKEKKLKVWDNSLERYVVIQESQFDPKWMTIKAVIS